MSYTLVAKPASTTYTTVNATVGKEIYNDPGHLFDDTTVFYNAVNASQYTKVVKPQLIQIDAILPGMATGLMMPLTYTDSYSFTGVDAWTRVAKPTS